MPLLWVMKGSYFGFGSPQEQGGHACKVKKHFHFLIICIYFYLTCSTTPKRFAQRLIFPNPSFAWRYSAVIGRFHLKQCLWAFRHLVAKNEFVFSFRPTWKSSFPRSAQQVGGQYAKQLGINFKNDSFQWFRVDSFFWETITLYTVHFQI